MKAVTVDQVMAWEPCQEYTRERVEALFAGREALTAADIVNLVDIPALDKMFAILHPEFLTEQQAHYLACDFAETALPAFERLFPTDTAPRLAVEAKRAWIRGEISDEELIAARAAARARVRELDTTRNTGEFDMARYAAWKSILAVSHAASVINDRITWKSAWSVATNTAWLAARTIEDVEAQLRKALEVING